MEIYDGRDVLYVRHYLSNGDSVVVDQVNGVFDADNNQNKNEAYACAGFVDASNEATLIRRFSVMQGNLDYDNARGLDLADSEWMPIEYQWAHTEQGHALFWTAGNHGDYNLDETTLVAKSGDVDLDFNTNILTVPWGTRRGDSIIFLFEYTPGIAWHYDYLEVFEDSAFVSAQTGDTITIYACGNDLDIEVFRIEVTPPGDDANIVVPKNALLDVGFFIDGDDVGHVFDVTDGVPGMDTISDLGFATRKDTLFKYLEKAPDATWEIVFIDNVDRPDLKDGDILKVTAKNGSVKEYYLKVEVYMPSDNAELASITWPDIPEFYIGIYGWDNGDTIPGFNPKVLNYSLEVPADVPGIPALVAKTDDVNATVKITRPTNIFGTEEQRTMTMLVTAEDGELEIEYKVIMYKEKLPVNLQQWEGTPFISEYTFWEQWNNSFMEIVNPGTLPLDISNYMIGMSYSNDPVEALTWNNENTSEAWGDRYIRYIPGYKWQNEEKWLVEPRIAERDLNVEIWIQPGDVFVMGDVKDTWALGYDWWATDACDIILNRNPAEPGYTETAPNYSGLSAVREWSDANFYVWEILNDSIKQGLKAATDPEDFKIIETWGGGDGANWVVGGVNVEMVSGFVRRPEYFQPKPGFKESWGTNDDDSEWNMFNEAYWAERNAGWPNQIMFITSDLGQHFMNDVTIYRSTISSNAYLVSLGFSHNESIRSLVDGTTVENFLPGIDKTDPGQSLSVVSSTDGSVMDSTATIVNGDTLVVLSADSVNTTKYVLEVTADGLSDDALLTSSTYDIVVDVTTGTVGGFDYGTTLETAISNVTLPQGANMTIIDDDDKFVPLKKLNFDTAYVDVQVSDKILLQVIAEDMQTTITYRLMPNAASSDAFVVSDVYTVEEVSKLISDVPQGTTVDVLYSNVYPVTGATMQLKDKSGLDRMEGEIYKDDNLLVVAQDQVTENTYFLAVLQEEINYLAYVTSNVYLVDQVSKVISGETLYSSTSVADFNGNLIAAPSASISVMDASMAEKSDGNMAEGDMVKVLAGNGVAQAFYDVEISTVSTEDLLDEGILIYPNPTSGGFRISGLETGNRIQIYNTLGVSVLDQKVFSSEEMVSLDKHQNGLYFVVISDGSEVRGHYKLVVK